MLIERLEAVATIISGNPNEADLDAAFMELDEIIKSLDHFGYARGKDTKEWKAQYNFPCPGDQMTDEHKEVATCRGCRRELVGKPYYMGGDAYLPESMEPARKNYYGGFVCSEACDHKASLELERSMPGHGPMQKRLSQGSSESLERNWRRDPR